MLIFFVRGFASVGTWKHESPHFFVLGNVSLFQVPLGPERGHEIFLDSASNGSPRETGK